LLFFFVVVDENQSTTPPLSLLVGLCWSFSLENKQTKKKQQRKMQQMNTAPGRRKYLWFDGKDTCVKLGSVSENPLQRLTVEGSKEQKRKKKKTKYSIET
jgi:hypothetical protein